ncbi:MAG: GntR family transcriptional regulator [Lachnospiraceae bacterium]|nr:GntR family transcriptional regulator [Lachnospiraceae bacterium]
MESLETNDVTPLYIQLAEKIRTLIKDGTWSQGEQILPESALCRTYQVSRITVRKAIDLLVDEKVLQRKQGKGTFVTYPDFFEKSCVRDHSFTASLIGRHIAFHTTVIRQSLETIDRSLITRFSIKNKSELYGCIVRIRSLAGEPAVYETDYLPERFHQLLDLNLNNQSLFGLLHEKMGVEPVNFYDDFHIVSASPYVAELLHVDVGHPLLSVAQTVLDANLEVIYYNEQLIKTETYTYSVRSYQD